jgi:hypothetical protein
MVTVQSLLRTISLLCILPFFMHPLPSLIPYAFDKAVEEKQSAPNPNFLNF